MAPNWARLRIVRPDCGANTNAACKKRVASSIRVFRSLSSLVKLYQARCATGFALWFAFCGRCLLRRLFPPHPLPPILSRRLLAITRFIYFRQICWSYTW